MTSQPIYLDHNATTPIHPEVVEAMTHCYHTVFGNPASQHRLGQHARRVLEDAREKIAQILDADLSATRRDRLIFTSGGTEANNLAILGIARATAKQPGQIVISSAEHQSVIESAEHLLESGWRLDTIGLTADGTVRLEQLAPLLSEQTCLVSVQLGNHETGALQPIADLAEICAKTKTLLHTDAVQAVGKIPVSFRRLNVAALSATAHKFGGPLGIGVLLLRNDVQPVPLMFGGHQQAGFRPGTESAALAVGMAAALELCRKNQTDHARRLQSLRERFESQLREGLPDIVVHAENSERLPQTSNIAFPGIDGQVLLMALDLAGVACSVGSACSSGSTELSPTLKAMDLPGPLVASSLRFSLGWTTTADEIDASARRIIQACRELRQ